MVVGIDLPPSMVMERNQAIDDVDS